MSRYLLFGALAVALSFGSSARAGTVLSFDPDGLGAEATITDFLGFDWLPGNALADRGNQAVANFIAGAGDTTFELYYHAKIFNVPPFAGGSLLTEAGPRNAPLNSEYTIVTAFREEVVDVTSAGGTTTAKFDLVAGAPNFLEVWYDSTPDADDLSGLGFNDGIRILGASVTDILASTFTANLNAPITDLDDFGTDNYPLIDTIQGSGSTQLQATVDFADPAFFKNLPPGLNVLFKLFTDFDTTQTLPFDSVNPSARFYKAPLGVAPVIDGAGAGVASLGTVNGSLTGSGGPDVQFEADANQSFNLQAVPEPASLAIWAVAAGLLGPFARRRRIAKA